MVAKEEDGRLCAMGITHSFSIISSLASKGAEAHKLAGCLSSLEIRDKHQGISVLSIRRRGADETVIGF